MSPVHLFDYSLTRQCWNWRVLWNEMEHHDQYAFIIPTSVFFSLWSLFFMFVYLEHYWGSHRQLVQYSEWAEQARWLRDIKKIGTPSFVFFFCFGCFTGQKTFSGCSIYICKSNRWQQKAPHLQQFWNSTDDSFINDLETCILVYRTRFEYLASATFSRFQLPLTTILGFASTYVNLAPETRLYFIYLKFFSLCVFLSLHSFLMMLGWHEPIGPFLFFSFFKNTALWLVCMNIPESNAKSFDWTLS